MKIAILSILLLATCISMVSITPARVVASELPNGEVAQAESGPGRANENGGSGIAAAIMCGSLSRIAVSTGMNPGVTSAAIGACMYMVLDGLFDFPW